MRVPYSEEGDRRETSERNKFKRLLIWNIGASSQDASIKVNVVDPLLVVAEWPIGSRPMTCLG